MNFLDARISAVGTDSVWVTIPTLAPGDHECRTLHSRPAVGTEVTVGIRSEHIEEAGAGSGFPATVSIVERLGSVSYAYVETTLGAHLCVERRVQREDHVGNAIRLRLMPECVFAFAATGKRL
jgi:lactose/L-arabinose transport system ATP-binding protein